MHRTPVTSTDIRSIGYDLQSSVLEVEFNSTVVRNAKKDAGWNDKSLLRKLYERYIINDNIENYKIVLYKDTEKIMDETKNFLALYRFK